MTIFKGLNKEKLVEGLFSGMDKSILTKEELTDLAVKAANLNFQFVKASHDESTPRSVTRRVIAIMVMAQYFITFDVGLLMYALGNDKGLDIMIRSTAAFGIITGMVMTFYFGNHMLNAVINKFSDKKVGK